MRILHELSVTIAHDFNNALCGALGFIELAIKDADAGPRVHAYLQIARSCILDAAEKVKHVQRRVQHEQGGPMGNKELSETMETSSRPTRPVADAALGLPPKAALAATPASLAILVVDDEPAVRQFLEHCLCRLGHRPAAACDGREALDRAACQHFDLVITDLGMPGMRGDELAVELRNARPTLPILMLTGWADQWTPDPAAASVINHVLAKPITIDHLDATIRQTVQR